MSILHDALVFMASALVAVPLFKRLGFGSVLGYLVAGVAIGPWALGLVSGVDSILHFSELGVILLLFIIGLELQPTRLWSLRKPVFGLGAAQVGVTGLILAAIALAFGQGVAPALVIGLGLALSSTAFVLQILAEKNELSTRHGRSAFAILLFQDLAVIPLMAIIPLLGAADGARAGLGMWISALEAAAAIAAVVVGGRFVLRPFLRLVASTRSHEMFTAAALFVVVGTALIMELVGLSMALGAFLAGVLLADSEYRHELEAEIEPFKGLLLGLFFIAVGMSVNLGLLVDAPARIAALVLGLLAVKLAVLYGLGRAMGLGHAVARNLAAVLPQGGEFAFVLFGVAAGAGVVARSTTEALILAVTLSMALTPFIVLAKDALAKGSGKREGAEYDRIEDDENPVIIAGFGRFGQIVARVLRMKGIRFTALESSFEQIDFVRRFGNKVYFGDAGRLDLLRAAKADKAKVFVLAVDDVEASIRIAELVRRHFPHLKVYARAHNRVHALKLMEVGVEALERETVAASLDLAEQVFDGLGVSADEAHRIVEHFREYDKRVLLEQYAVRHSEEEFIETSRQAAQRLEGLFEQDTAEAAAE